MNTINIYPQPRNNFRRKFVGIFQYNLLIKDKIIVNSINSPVR
jgi:hypothetical protein